MIRKHSVSLHGHRTSFSLEDAFFEELSAITEQKNISLSALLRMIDETRAPDVNLSSAIRLFILSNLKAQTRPV